MRLQAWARFHLGLMRRLTTLNYLTPDSAMRPRYLRATQVWVTNKYFIDRL